MSVREESVPHHRPSRRGFLALDRDEYLRPSTTMPTRSARFPPHSPSWEPPAAGPHGETLDQIAEARYPDAGPIQHVHTAGNPAALSMAPRQCSSLRATTCSAHGLRPRARIRAMATIGPEPLIMLTAPARRSRKALAAAGMTTGDIDSGRSTKHLLSCPSRRCGPSHRHGCVNVNGGAIALGHPLGATGAILLGTLLDELERRDLATGLVTLCIGGGQGVATIVERRFTHSARELTLRRGLRSRTSARETSGRAEYAGITG